MNNHSQLPVAVIGTGPVGLAAAAHLLERGETPLVLEAGPAAGASIRHWAHVRMFSPWRYTVDAASRRLLERTGWQEPAATELPTGGDLVSKYLEPLATHTALRQLIHFNQRVTAVTRLMTDKVRTKERESRPFVIRTVAPDGTQNEYLAKAVIDASGTWTKPNPMGADGLQPMGEEHVRDRIDYGIPDVRGARRSEFVGTTVIVVGSGHSAFNAVLDLLALKQEVPETRVVWAMRRASHDKVFGGGAADALPARGELGQRAKDAIASGALSVITPFSIQRLARVSGGRVQVTGEREGREQSLEVDRIIVATGFRPDIDMLREVRLELDPWLESTRALGPLIDPNLHSCGTVRPHGARELAHPEKDFYIVGMKSYGRAPTFLLATGYEQVRSVVAELVSDHEGAARVELDLPETGVCGLPGSGDAVGEGCCGVSPKKRPEAEAASVGCGCGGASAAPGPATAPVAAAEPSGCCGGAPKRNANACCALDEEKKAAGEEGCGCVAGSTATKTKPKKATACCE
ncbi:MAG: FAD-dependent oxidoreductase [Verrucomicrobiota bacterium]